MGSAAWWHGALASLTLLVAGACGDSSSNGELTDAAPLTDVGADAAACHADILLVAGTFRELTSRDVNDYTTRDLATVTTDDAATVAVLGISSAVVSLQASKPGCTALHYTLSGSATVHTATVEVLDPAWFLMNWCTDVVGDRRTRFAFIFYEDFTTSFNLAKHAQGRGRYPIAIDPPGGATLVTDASDANAMAVDIGAANVKLDTLLKANPAQNASLSLFTHSLATMDTFGPSSTTLPTGKVSTLQVVLASTSELAAAMGRSYSTLKAPDGTLALKTCTGVAAHIQARGWPYCQLIDTVTRDTVNQLDIDIGSFEMVAWSSTCTITITITEAGFESWSPRTFSIEADSGPSGGGGLGGGGGGGFGGLGD